MSELLRKINPGETREINADVWNALVGALDRTGAPGPFRVAATSRYAEVHYDDSGTNPYPLTPGEIYIQDATDWHSFDKDKVEIELSLEGVGELDRTTMKPGEAARWTWNEGRSWHYSDERGRKLPLTVVVTAVARILTEHTTKPSVEMASELHNLPGVVEGDRALVRSEGTVYRYDGFAWVPTSGATWVAAGSERVSIVVARAFNPALIEGLSLGVYPEAEAFELGESGKAEIKIYDFSTFPDATTSSRRTLEVFYLDEKEERVRQSHLTVSSALLENVHARPTGERTVTLSAGGIGSIELVATYEYTTGGSTETVEITRRLKCFPAMARTIPTAVPPTTPDTSLIRVTPGNGKTTIGLGLPLRVTRWTQTSAAREIFSVVEPAQQVANALVTRLSDDRITLFKRPEGQGADTALNSAITRRFGLSSQAPAALRGGDVQLTTPQAVQLLNATTVVHNTLTSYTGGLVHTYRIEADPGDASLTPGSFTSIQAGQVLYVPEMGAALRLIKNPTTENNKVIIEAEGLLDVATSDLYLTPPSLEAWISGSADLLLVRARFAYGQTSDADFPRPERSFVVERLLDPKGMLPRFDQPLPLGRSLAQNDGWYVRLEVAAAFRGLVYEVYKDQSWRIAEEVPQIPAALEAEPSPPLHRVGRFLKSPLKAAPYDFFGYYELQDASQSETPSYFPERIVNERVPLRPGEPIPIGNEWATKKARLYLHGQFRSKGGTCGAVQTLWTSGTYSADGAPVIIRSASNPVPVDGPDVNAPAADGVFLIDIPTGRVWLSAGGDWNMISGSNVPPPANQVPAFTGGDQQLIWGKPFSFAVEVQDPDGYVVAFSVTGRPEWMEATHQYYSGNQWLNGAAVAPRRRIVFSGTAPAAETAVALNFSATDNASATTTHSVQIIVEENTPPVVSLSVIPTTVSQGSPLTMSATASDPESGIDSIQFQKSVNDGDWTVVSTVTTPPYQAGDTPSVLGTTRYRAVATNGAGQTSFSEIVSVSVIDTTAPTVTFSLSKTSAVTGEVLTLTAQASDSGSGMDRVEFLRAVGSENNWTEIGEDSQSPYSMTYSESAPGTYRYCARAIDKSNNSILSNIVTVTVAVADNPPSITLNSSVSSVELGYPVTLMASPTDDKGVKHVIFERSLNSGASWTQVGSPVAAAPYSVTDYPTVNARYRARVTDTADQTALSNTVDITVTPDAHAPSIRIANSFAWQGGNDLNITGGGGDGGSGVFRIHGITAGGSTISAVIDFFEPSGIDHASILDASGINVSYVGNRVEIDGIPAVVAYYTLVVRDTLGHETQITLDIET